MLDYRSVLILPDDGLALYLVEFEQQLPVIVGNVRPSGDNCPLFEYLLTAQQLNEGLRLAKTISHDTYVSTSTLCHVHPIRPIGGANQKRVIGNARTNQESVSPHFVTSIFSYQAASSAQPLMHACYVSCRCGAICNACSWFLGSHRSDLLAIS